MPEQMLHRNNIIDLMILTQQNHLPRNAIFQNEKSPATSAGLLHSS